MKWGQGTRMDFREEACEPLGCIKKKLLSNWITINDSRKVCTVKVVKKDDRFERNIQPTIRIRVTDIKYTLISCNMRVLISVTFSKEIPSKDRPTQRNETVIMKDVYPSKILQIKKMVNIGETPAMMRRTNFNTASFLFRGTDPNCKLL